MAAESHVMNEFAVTADWLRAQAEASPASTALCVDGEDFSFGELDAGVSRLCGYLSREGVEAGEHIGILMPNSMAAVCCIFAMARLGTVLVPLNTRLTPGELAYQVEHSDCRRLLCVVGSESNARELQEKLEGRLTVHTLPESAREFATWLDTQDALPAESLRPAQLNSLQAIQFTSGTTGFPKGAMISYANHFWGAVGSAFRLGVQANDRWLVCLPLYHVGGIAILFRSCLYGTTVVLQRGFEIHSALQHLRADGITLVSLVPTMLTRLMAHGLTHSDAPALRLILLGGAAAPQELFATAEAAGLPVAVTFGLTEAASQVATLMPAGAAKKPGSAGRPLLFSELKIIDENGSGLEPNRPGEIVVRGPTVMDGYYGDSATTYVALEGGWLHTGDIGYLDQDGDLWILDRRSDLIISGGENVYPAEIERVLAAHPSVASVCVIGMPHPDWGQQVAAFVVPNESTPISAEELLTFGRAHLAGYKQPRLVVFGTEMPLTSSGKIHRREVANRLASLAKTE